MRNGIGLVCSALLLASALARADLLPEPDRGPPIGSVGGLDFRIEWVDVEMGPAKGPHYKKRLQVVVLAGCAEEQPNCQLARDRNLIGMEVQSVDGQHLQPEKGMVRQILDAFTSKVEPASVTLELYSRATNTGPFKIGFSRH